MEWGRARWLAAILLLPVAGCGGAEATSNAATPLLIRQSDLPGSEVRPDSPPKACSPILLLEQHGAVVDGTLLFKLGRDNVAEVVGIVPSVTRARQALAELQARERMDCIQTTIEDFGPGEGDGVNIGTPVSRAEGDEGSMVQLVEVDSASRPVNFTTVVSLRSGPCVATLLVLTRGERPKDDFIDQVSGRAYERLAGGRRTCR
jgi:hypothetical protein